MKSPSRRRRCIRNALHGCGPWLSLQIEVETVLSYATSAVRANDTDAIATLTAETSEHVQQLTTVQAQLILGEGVEGDPFVATLQASSEVVRACRTTHPPLPHRHTRDSQSPPPHSSTL